MRFQKKQASDDGQPFYLVVKIILCIFHLDLLYKLIDILSTSEDQLKQPVKHEKHGSIESLNNTGGSKN